MSNKNHQVLKLREFIPYQLSVVTNRISTAFARLYSTPFNLSIHEWRVLAVLGEKSGLSAEQVGVETEMVKVSVSRAVARLLQKKLLHRTFSAEDKRRSVLRLTARGRASYRRIVPLALRFEKELECVLTRAELKQLEHCLAKLHRYVRALD